MNKKDKECYKKRYSDLNGVDPLEHYLTVG
jgi:hypothetical protein